MLKKVAVLTLAIIPVLLLVSAGCGTKSTTENNGQTATKEVKVEQGKDGIKTVATVDLGIWSAPTQSLGVGQRSMFGCLK